MGNDRYVPVYVLWAEWRGGGPVWEEGIVVGLNPLVTNWAWDLMGLEFSFVLQMSKLVAILKKDHKLQHQAQQKESKIRQRRKY